MHSYANMREKHGKPVSQTIDSPIMIFDHWELGDAFAAIGVVLVFGVMFYEWTAMMALLIVVLGIGPVIKCRNEKGIFLHWPYRKFGISLPGLVNPKGGRTYSD